MAENTNNTGAPGGLYFIVGGLVVAVGIGAFLIYGDPGGPDLTKTTITEQSTTAPAPAGGTTTTTTKEQTQQQ